MVSNMIRPHTAASLLDPIREATLTGTGLATSLHDPRPVVGPGAIQRSGAVIADLFGAVVLVLGVPFVILAAGLPIALFVRFLLWLARML